MTTNVFTVNSASPALDMILTEVLLEAARDHPDFACVRVFRPGATVAFGRLDRLEANFHAACRLASDRGHTPVVRLGGGRAVVYDDNCVVIEIVRRRNPAVSDFGAPSHELADLLRTALSPLGIDLVMGELPGEYCPGRFSLRMPRGPKVAGIAQRLIRGASLTTAVLVVDRSGPLRAITTDIYAELGLPLDPSTVGALSDQHSGVGPAQVMSVVVNRAIASYHGELGEVPSSFISQARNRFELSGGALAPHAAPTHQEQAQQLATAQ